MWDGLSTTMLIALAVVAVVVGAGLGLLPRSRWRFTLIGIWSAAPVILVLWATGMTAVDMRSIDLPMSLSFAAVFTLILLPPWALLTLLPFNLVRRYREIQRWQM
jgi:hypothetical protein